MVHYEQKNLLEGHHFIVTNALAHVNTDYGLDVDRVASYKKTMKYDLVLSHCDLFTHSGPSRDSTRFLHQTKVHVGVKQGKIAKISSSPLEGIQEINLQGLTLLPGIIDSQVHMREPGMTHKEDLEAGTRAAALGGITSVFEMPNTVPATTTKALLEDKFKRAAGRAWVNHGFFIGGSPENVDELALLEKLPGCPGIKIFMGSSTGSLLVEDDPTLEKIFRQGSRRVILHSEDEMRLRSRKHIAVESKSVLDHPVWRDELTALMSTERLLKLSRLTGRKVHVLHVTTAEEMSLLARNKDIASVEVLPQHLTLSAPECYERLGTLAQQNPPIRGKHHQEALWKAVNNKTVDVIGSDHAPHTLEEKAKEYPGSPSGVPGVQTLLPLMLNHIHEGRLSLERFLEMVCENPRWVFGCQTKGRIEEGLDADFTVVDLKIQKTISNSWIASRCGWTPFDGMEVAGWPQMTIVGGHVVMRDDQILGSPLGKPVSFET
jgi:dihydroorotase